MIDNTQIINQMFAAKDKEEYIRGLMTYDLLIIDCFGQVHNSEYNVDITKQIITKRIETNKPMILVTSRTLQELKDEGKSVYCDIVDRFVPVGVIGHTNRSQLRIQKMNVMRDVFSHTEGENNGK